MGFKHKSRKQTIKTIHRSTKSNKKYGKTRRKKQNMRKAEAAYPNGRTKLGFLGCEGPKKNQKGVLKPPFLVGLKFKRGEDRDGVLGTFVLFLLNEMVFDYIQERGSERGDTGRNETSPVPRSK